MLNYHICTDEKRATKHECTMDQELYALGGLASSRRGCSSVRTSSSCHGQCLFTMTLLWCSGLRGFTSQNLTEIDTVGANESTWPARV